MRRLLVLLTVTTLAACGTNGDGSLPGPGPYNQINVYQNNGTALTTSASAPSALHFAIGVSNESFVLQEHNYTGSFGVNAHGPCLIPENGTDGTTGTTTSVVANGTLTFQSSSACKLDGHVEVVTVGDSLGNLVTQYFSINS